MSASVSSPAFTPQRSGRMFSRNFLLISLVNLLIMSAYYLLFVINVPFMLERFNVSQSTAGIVTGIIVIGCLIGRFLTGYLVSLFPFRWLLLLGLAGYCGISWCYCAVETLEALFSLRFLLGFSIGVISTVTATVIAYIVPEEHRGLGISYFTMSTALALALGPLLGLSLLQRIHYEHIFQLCFGMALASVLLGLALELRHLSHRADRASRSLLSLRNYLSYRVIPFGIFAMTVSLGYSNIQAFIAPYAAQRHLMTAASFFFLVYGIAVLATRPLSGRIFDLRGENAVMYPSLGFMFSGLLLLGLGSTSVTLLLSAVLLGIGFGNFQSASQVIALNLVTPDRFAQATSTFFIFFDLGVGVGPYLLGFLVPCYGYDGLFLTLSAVTLVAVLLYYLLHGRTHGHPSR